MAHRNCSRKCVTVFLNSLNFTPSFFADMESFVKSSRENVKPAKILSFIQDLINKKLILCEVGLFYTEKYIFLGIYNNTFYTENCNRNIFVNNKLMLYSWIEPRHLEINIIDYDSLYYIFDESNVEANLQEIIHIFGHIETSLTSGDKIDILMETIKNIYGILTENDGNDVFFPLFVFIIVKSKVRNLLLHLKFIQKYKRKRFLLCKDNCGHLANVETNTSCECYFNATHNTKEIDYYLTTFEAAIMFIERLEYNNLKIERKEFDQKFSKHMATIEFEKPLIVLKNKKGWFKKTINKIKKHL